MNNLQQYDPYKFPASINLAQIHLKCSCAGKANVQSFKCPCCCQFQKLPIQNWIKRSITDDFQCYGGGVTAYFSVIKYMFAILLCLSLVISVFHIFTIEKVCEDPQQKCTSFLQVFKFCSFMKVFNWLKGNNHEWMATILMVLIMFQLIVITVLTIGMSIFLQVIKRKKIGRSKKAYNKYSLILKNIPLFYREQEIKMQLQSKGQGINIQQLFHVYQLSNYHHKFKKLVDLNYQVQYFRQKINSTEPKQSKPRQSKKLEKLQQQYKILYEEVVHLHYYLIKPSGQAIVVFKDKKSKDIILTKYKISLFKRLKLYILSIISKNSQITFYADPIEEPFQIQWKYIGQSPNHQNKVVMITTLIGIGFIAICGILLYYPIIQIYEQMIYDHSKGSILSLCISLLLQILSISYRVILIRLIPIRKPGSKLQESYFILSGTVVFHFFFYVAAPATYFMITPKIPQNIKLKQLFLNVFAFAIIILIIALINIRLLLYKFKKKSIFSSKWKKMPQFRIHQQLKYPQFPIEYKYMILLNIWTFYSYYAYSIPTIPLMFAIVLFIIFWIDKKDIYTKFKTNSYHSIDIYIEFQKVYVYLFLLSACGGFAITIVYNWQYYFLLGVFIIGLFANIILNYKFSQEQVIEQQKQHLIGQKQQKQQIQYNKIQLNWFRISFNWLSKFSSKVGSLNSNQNYKQLWNEYISQFHNQIINEILTKKYEEVNHKLFYNEEQLSVRSSHRSNIKYSIHPQQSLRLTHRQSGPKLSNLEDFVRLFKIRKVNHPKIEQIKHQDNNTTPFN